MAFTGTNPTIVGKWPDRLQTIDPDWDDVVYHITKALDIGNIPTVLKAIELLLDEDKDKVSWDEVTDKLRVIIHDLTID